MSGFEEIVNEELTSHTEIERSAITAKLTGSAETGAMAELDGFLRRIHAAALAQKVGEVVVDLRSLEFMNSSCFKAFVAWIGRLQDSPADAQYHVRFVADEKKHWQSRSLAALSCFAVDLIRVEAG